MQLNWTTWHRRSLDGEIVANLLMLLVFRTKEHEKKQWIFLYFSFVIRKIFAIFYITSFALSHCNLDCAHRTQANLTAFVCVCLYVLCPYIYNAFGAIPEIHLVIIIITAIRVLFILFIFLIFLSLAKILEWPVLVLVPKRMEMNEWDWEWSIKNRLPTEGMTWNVIKITYLYMWFNNCWIFH